jgi:hypothetical protein
MKQAFAKEVIMKINFQIFILYLIFFVLIAGNLYAQRMQPPPVLIEIIEEFSKMESKFENKKWHEASDTLAAIKEKIEQLKMADANQLDFNKVIDRLKLAFEKKDIKTTENNYIQLQQMLFLYSDNFDYKIPPIISIMNKYINDEAAEALEKNDYDEVYSEMREVGSFFRNSRALL